MPLLISPIDNQTPMQQIRRDGIEIDRCPVSGGVWLDKGELEKLLGLVQQAVVEDRQSYAQFSPPKAPHPAPMAPQHYHKHYDDDYETYHYKKYGKKSKLKTFFDIFD
jgi:Zn-finger nucleic acid-binding protein